MIRIKNQIHNRMRLPVDKITEIPTGELPANVQFLAVDSDAEQLSKKCFFGNTRLSQTGDESVSIKPESGTSVSSILHGLQQAKKDGIDYAQWIHPDVRAIVHGDGAGQQRAVGRALFFHCRTGLKNKIQEKLNQMPNGAANTTIFLLTGISGGTGSGTFLDMGYLLRDIAPVNSKIMAYIFMPEVNFKNATGDDGERANVYAALKELDFLLEEGKMRRHPFIQAYNGTEVSLSKDFLFHFCHLVDVPVMTQDAFALRIEIIPLNN